jgi:type III secretory pathway component EscR
MWELRNRFSLGRLSKRRFSLVLTATLLTFFVMVFAGQNSDVDPNTIAAKKQQEAYQKYLESDEYKAYLKQQEEAKKAKEAEEAAKASATEEASTESTETK